MIPKWLAEALPFILPLYPVIKDIKKYVDKKRFEDDLKKEVADLKQEYEDFLFTARVRGVRLRKKVVLEKTVYFLDKLADIKTKIVEYSKAYFTPRERAGLRIKLRSLDSMMEEILQYHDLRFLEARR
jgi:hypothetical protein